MVQDFEDARNLRPGEILVTSSVDPGWTVLFPRAGALVMEVGGVLSHGAVVAREMNLPAVVGRRVDHEEGIPAPGIKASRHKASSRAEHANNPPWNLPPPSST